MQPLGIIASWSSKVRGFISDRESPLAAEPKLQADFDIVIAGLSGLRF